MATSTELWTLIQTGNLKELSARLLTFHERFLAYQYKLAKDNARVGLFEYRQGRFPSGLSFAITETHRALAIHHELTSLEKQQ